MSICLFWAVVAAIILLNVLAWNSAAFCDWYIAHIFPIWVNTYGRLTGIFPFSVGEWLIVAGLLLVAAALLIGVICGFFGLVRLGKYVRFHMAGGKAERTASSRNGRFFRIARCYYRFFSWTLLAVCLIMTLNCLILYHASTFSAHYFGEDDGSYTSVELVILYNMVAEKCNDLAEQIRRSDEGDAVYVSPDGTEICVRDAEGWSGGLAHMADEAGELMAQLGERYPQLAGWYPRPKAMLFSDFMCQQYMQGYYFPFSMEANYNDVMHILNIPSTMCHELAHLRGYIYEDEANFISYLACVESENVFFQYAGYLSVLNYLYNDVYKLWKTNPEAYEETVAVVQPAAISEQVWKDNIFVSDQEWDRINGKALIDTEIIDAAADVFVDTNLKVTGVSDGKISYNRVVRLLLQYYRKNIH